jgi:DNA-binding response OmpR family regulator
MKTIMLVADKQSTSDRVHTALAGSDVAVVDHTNPKTAAEVAYESGVDSVVVDMQVAAMGAMALTRSLRAGAGTADPIPVTILLDREADSFLAKRAGAANWLTKDYTPDQLRAAVGAS